jgi:hypothetical protein
MVGSSVMVDLVSRDANAERAVVLVLRIRVAPNR